jgi:elongation factor Ts
MSIGIEQVRELRELTGAGVLDAKNALESTNGDMEAAVLILREKGLATAAKKAGREARQGRIVSYVHDDPGRVGVLLEINCETDFVARTDGFRNLATEISMQIAALSPRWVHEDDIPQAILEQERQIIQSQMADEKKPPEILEKILAGKLNKWFSEVVLLKQPYMRDDDLTVGQLITNAIAEMGENIVVRRFQRFELGEQVDGNAEEQV